MVAAMNPLADFPAAASSPRRRFALCSGLLTSLLLAAASAAPLIQSAPVGTWNLWAGGSPSYHVKADSASPLAYAWKRNGADLPDNFSASTPDFTLLNTTLASAGSYTVTVSDATGSTTSAPFAINISNPPPGETYAASVLADGPTAYWKLNETSGTLLADVAGGHQGTYNLNRVERGLSGPRGIAPDAATRIKLSTNGVSASVPFSPNLNPAGAFSVECWVKPDLSGNTGKAVFSSQNRSTGRAGYVIYQGNSGNCWDAQLGSGGSFVAIAGRTPIVAGRWDHVVLTYNGSETASLYVNGVLERTATFVLPFRNNLSAPLEIGSRSGGELPFAGAVDELAFYNYELSAEQVERHFSISYFPITISAQPIPITNAVEAQTITLTASVTGFPNTYEWLFNGSPLYSAETNADGSRRFPQGSTSPTLVITQALPTDAGDYTLNVYNPLGDLPSDTAAVNVALDTSAPSVAYVAATLLNRIRVGFTRPMTPDDQLFNPANYTFTQGLTIIGIAPTSDPAVVDLITTGMVSGDSYSLSVAGVTDLRISQNPIGPNQTTFSTSVLAAAEIFLGGDEGEGLDLDGTFPYAMNFGTNGTVGQARDANFTSDSAPGISWSAPNQIPNWHNPTYGDTPNDDVIEQVMQSIRWNTGPVTVNLANLVPGQTYKLQLLFAEQCCANRGFDIRVEGLLVVNDLLPALIQGGPGNTSQGVVVTYQFTAPDNVLNIQLTSDLTTDPAITDHNPILNGLTLESLTLAPPDLKRITSLTRSPSLVTLQALGTPGKNYRIDYSPHLGSWIEVNNSFVPGPTGAATWSDTEPSRVGPAVLRGYYRLRDPDLKPNP